MTGFSEHYLDSILRHADDALLAVDGTGRLRSWSRGAEAVLGRPSREVLGQHIDRIVPGLSFHDLVAALAGRDLVELGELRVRRGDGAWAYVEVRVTPVRDRDRHTIAYSLIARDVSIRRTVALARQRDEAERQYLLEREQAARAEAEAANVAKDEFLSVLSHELRTPLSTIAGWAELLQSGELEPEESRDAVATILRNADLQRHLVEDLLDVSRIVAGRLRLQHERVDLAEPTAAALAAAEPAARAKRIELTTSYDTGIWVRGDPARLTQVVSNLLSNAIKFASPGGHVAVELRGSPGQAILRVQDDGAGIAPENLARLFERFWSADSSNTRSHGGLGLGLAIVQHLVERHGGTVRAESAGPGCGSAFTVTLPRA